jgi:hypothetical protein
MNKDLKIKILEIFKSKGTFKNPGWGFSAIGHRDIAVELGISNISASNSMRQMLKDKVFYKCTSKNRYDQTTYFLKNDKI